MLLRLEQAHGEARKTAYFQRIALAEREWSSNNLSRAVELLEQCPPDLRGWEWHFLTRLLRGKTLPPLEHGSAVLGAAISPDGRWVLSGVKHYITRADIAHVFTVFALTDGKKRARGGITKKSPGSHSKI